MKEIMMTKKFRYALAVMAFIGCASAFAADSQTQDQPNQSSYACCHDGQYGHGHHRNCDW